MEDERKAISEMCIICLSTLKSMDAIWSCGQCYCVFHLSCIHSWAADSLHTRSRGLSTQLFPNQTQLWSCPKCRRDYTTIPSRYMCYCGKMVDPPFDAWLSPHSCGEVCSRGKSHCPHSCTSLCHPGACPPCPKTVSMSCYCGKSPSQVKRCGAGGWSCLNVCSRVLSCGLHTCERTCHQDECGPCSQLILTSCVCGRASKEWPCETDVWSCEKPCLKPFSCGHHYCQKVCHSGICGECPLSLPRTCPCSKTKHDLPCTMDTPTCGDSCDALLTCGRHHCTRPCHHGDCGLCIQVNEKSCRCGKRRKSLPCSLEEWLCENRCQRLRNCQNHSCRRKCCDGLCPMCEAVCGKTLSCRKHKCASPCHQGRCYPCIATVSVSCVCGSSSISVPCGQERATQVPSCEEPCTLPSCCLHPHTCHPPPCPPCTKPCGNSLDCGHTCKAVCHSTPKPKARPRGLAPWVKMVDSELVRERCPPCCEAMRVVCVGGHESQLQPCSERKQYSCVHNCGRILACGNHTCQRNCHQVIQPIGEQMAGRNCVECEEWCTRPRPPGCSHLCPLSCHTGACPACVVLVKVPCHCGTLTLLIKCCEWADGRNQEDMCCCDGQCSHKLICGHRCPLTCHSGQCTEVCNRKVTSRCPCGIRKKEVLCSSGLRLTCDTKCERVAIERAQALEVECELSRSQETAAQHKALLEAQRQGQTRRRRRRGGRGLQELATPTSKATRTSGVLIIALVLTTGLIITIGIFLTL